jgi:hypothetical protein
MIGSVSSGFPRPTRLNASSRARHAAPIPIPAGRRRSPSLASARAGRKRAWSPRPDREASSGRVERVDDVAVDAWVTVGADRSRLCGRFADVRCGTAAARTSAGRTFAAARRAAGVAATAASTLEARTDAGAATRALADSGKVVAVPSPAEAWALSASAGSGSGSAPLASGSTGVAGPPATASPAAGAAACSTADTEGGAETASGGKNKSGSTYPCSSLVVRTPK